MRQLPGVWWTVADFQTQNSGAPFIGYEAGTQISILLKKRFIESRWSDEKRTLSGRRVKEYRIAPQTFAPGDLTATVECIHSSIKPEPVAAIQTPLI